MRFDLRNPRGIALSGTLLNQPLPKSATIEIDSHASALAMLQMTAFPAAFGDEVGAYDIHFADGSAEHVPLKYGMNIRAADDPGSTSDATLAWSGKSSRGISSFARVFIWNNPHPDRPIKSITFSTNHAYASPILIGLTCLDSAEVK